MRFNVFVLIWFVISGWAGLTQAALPIFESKLHVKLVDSKTNKPISGAIVAAAETYYWSGYHRSGTTCFRATSGLLDAKDGVGTLRLPSVDLVTSTRVLGETRHIELYAYRPGYCAAQPFSSSSTAGFLKWANKHDPNGIWGNATSPTLGSTVTIKMSPSSDPPEHRLRHLTRVAKVIGRSCPDLKSAYFDALIPAMIKEADSIASSQLERLLASRVKEAFDETIPRRNLWPAYDAYAASGQEVELRRMLGWAKSDPLFEKSHYVPELNGSIAIQGSSDSLPLEPGFSFNHRNERGSTPLMEAVSAMQLGTTRLLLEAGADIDILSGPGGYTALDLVLSRARNDVKEAGTEGFEAQLLRMIDLLVHAKPAPTVHPRYYEELSDTAKWKLGVGANRFWREVRAKIMPLSPRKPVLLICPIDDIAKNSLQLFGEPEKSR